MIVVYVVVVGDGSYELWVQFFIVICDVNLVVDYVGFQEGFQNIFECFEVCYWFVKVIGLCEEDGFYCVGGFGVVNSFCCG